jgi:hypothetical protein
MKPKQLAIVLPMVLLAAACIKDELPVPAQPRGEARTVQLCMGTGYVKQYWLRLSDGAVVSENNRADWDLAFESAPGGWRIMLNGARLMTAWDAGAIDIAAPHDTAGMAAGRRIDAPSGHPDSTAIGDWRGTGKAFIIDLGVDGLGQSLGFVKLKPVGVDAAAFTVQCAALDGSEVRTLSVPKDAQRAWTALSLANGVRPIEPAVGNWDLCFTQYTHQFYEPFLPYLVNGVLLASTTRAARIDGRSFAAVAAADTLAHPLMAARNVIGYDWKQYSFTTGTYTLVPDRTYLVRNAAGYLYKLRFLDFYSAQGLPGCPLFESVPL